MSAGLIPADDSSGRLTVDRLALIERWAENFGLDLASPIEAALAQQEAEHVAQLVDVAVRAGRREAADAIVAHADEWAPAAGNTEQRRMRRHLLIAARVAAPDTTRPGWYVMHEHGDGLRHVHSTVQGHSGSTTNPRANDHSCVEVICCLGAADPRDGVHDSWCRENR